MNTIRIRLILCFFTIFSLQASAQQKLTFTAWLTGAEEVPAVETDARGVASFRLSENRDSLIIMALVTGLSGPVTGAAILESRRGTTGGALRSLELIQAGNKFYGVITGEDLPEAMIAKMLSGETYMNIFTDENPTGEIRGQIELEKDFSWQATLNSSQVVPAVTSNAFGVASVKLSMDKSVLQVKAQFSGIGNITGVYLAMASRGNNGSNVLDLTQYLSGNRIDKSFSTTNLPLLEKDSLLENKIYMYVTSGNYTNGEIRGQLLRNYGLDFTADLNGAQEVPSVSTNASGLGIFRLKEGLDTLVYDIVFQDLSTTITGAHLHLGEKGQTGGVVVDLSDSIDGNRIKGKAYGVAITRAIVNAMIRGDIYVNIHTQKNPDGEIRGQLNSTLRKTYSFELCGQQEVPEVNTIAMGLGVVSISQDSTSLHYKIVADSLSSQITGAHFHKAPINQNGDVVLPILFQYNASYGFVSDSASATVVRLLAKDIAEEQIYVNIHTANHTNGEIRGQVIDKALCSQIVGLAERNIPGAEISLYPMPFKNSLTIEIDAVQSGKYSVSLFDLQGKLIQHETAYIQSGKNALSLNFDNEKTGLYMLRITDDKGNSYSQKVLRR